MFLKPTMRTLNKSVLFGQQNFEYLNSLSLAELLSNSFVKNADKIAIIDNDISISYRELSQLVDNYVYSLRCIDEHLYQKFITVSMSRSYSSIAACLAIIKLGAIYVPIDFKYGEGYKNSILNIINSTIEITNSFKVIPDVNIAQQLIPQTKANDLVYLIFTSGTTGKPKGVKCHQQGIINRLLWMRDYLGIDDEIFLHKTSISFDVSLWEIILPFLCNSRLVILPSGSEDDMEKINETIKKHKVSICHFVPTMLDYFLRYPKNDNINSLKTVITSGEALKPHQANKFHNAFKKAKLYNLYGPTEASIDVTAKSIQENEAISIGKPISNTIVYVLNDEKQLIEKGEIGEIAISGVGVALGYYNDELNTKNNFHINQFSTSEQYHTLYLTGDLGYIDDNNELVCLGRKDRQIKIGGYRIDIEAIESVICQLTGANDTVVSVIDRNGVKILVGFTINRSINLKLINEVINANLPSYMQLKDCVPLEKIPYTLNGKLDDKAIQAIYADDYEIKNTTNQNLQDEHYVFLKNFFKKTNLKSSDYLIDFGIDSLGYIELLHQFYEKGIHITLAELKACETIEQLISLLKLPPKNTTKSEKEAGDKIYNQLALHKIANLELADINTFAQCCILNLTCSKKDLDFSIHSISQFMQFQMPGYFDINTINNKIILNPLDEKFISLTNYSYLEHEKLIDTLIKKLSLKNGPVVIVNLIPNDDFFNVAIVIHHFYIDNISWRSLIRILGSSSSTPAAEYRKTHYLEYYSSINPKNVIDKSLYYKIATINKKLFNKSKEKKLLTYKNIFEFNEAIIGVDNIPAIILAGFVQGLDSIIDFNEVAIFIETHGRGQADYKNELISSLGYYTAIIPIIVNINSQNLNSSVLCFKELIKESIENSCEDYIYLSRNAECINVLRNSVVFNFQGIWHDGQNIEIKVPPVFDIMPKDKLLFGLEISGWIINSELHVNISAKSELIPEDRFNAITALFQSNMQNMLKGWSVFENISLPTTPIQSSMYWENQLLKSQQYTVSATVRFPWINNKDKIVQSITDVIRNEPVLNIKFIELNNKVLFKIQQKNIDEHLEIYDDANLTNFNLIKYFDLSSELNYKFSICFYKGFVEIIFCYHHILMDGMSVYLLFNKIKELVEEKIRCSVMRDYKLEKFAYYNYLISKTDPKVLKFWINRLTKLDLQNTTQVLKGGSKTLDKTQYGQKIIELKFKDLDAIVAKFHCNINSIVITLISLALIQKNKSCFGIVLSTRDISRIFIKHMGLFIQALPFCIPNYCDTSIIEYIKLIQTEIDQVEKNKLITSHDLTSVAKKNTLYDCVFVNEIYQSRISETSLDLIMDEFTEFPLLIHLTKVNNNTIVLKLVHQLHCYSEKELSSFIDSIQQSLEKFTNIQANDMNKKQIQISNILQSIVDISNQSPEMIAAITEEKVYSYQEFITGVKKLAKYLQEKCKISYKSKIGILFSSSYEMLLSIHAVVYLGGIYVPLNKNFPDELNLSICDSSEVELVLTDDFVAAAIAVPALKIDQHLIDRLIEPINSTPYPVTSEDIIYIMHTSGSTGKPKGVAIKHAGILNQLNWLNHFFQISSDDKVLLKTPISFDVSILELFWPLVNAAQVYILDESLRYDLKSIAEIIDFEKISIVHFVPTVLNRWLNELDKDITLKYVIASGEALSPSTISTFYQKVNAELYNLYGPTEASVHASAYKCDREFQEDEVPIGKPIDNVEFYVLDENKFQVAENMMGELYIGGICLAEGYINLPEETDKSFVIIKKIGYNRLYKTGDLVKKNKDGNYVYLGRIDDQIKIGGVRIQLNQIQKTLLELSIIQDAAVIYDDESIKLIAFVVLQKDAIAYDKEAIITSLSKKIPISFIPNKIFVLEAIPYQINGKLDKRKLDDIYVKSLSDSSLVIKEASVNIISNKNKLRNIWEKILMQPVVETTNFFHSGGNSLLAIDLLTAITKDNSIKINIFDLYRNPEFKQFYENVYSEKSEFAEQN